MAATDYDFSLTRNEIIELAHRKVGAFSHGDGSLTAEQLADGIKYLHMIVAEWQNQDVMLWTRREITQAITAGDADYTSFTDPKLIGLDQAWYMVGNVRNEVEVITYCEYLDIPDKTVTGDPIQVCLDMQETLTMYVYPTPSANRTMKLLGVVALEDFDSASSLGEFNSRWYTALMWALASFLAPDYGASRSERDDFDGKAQRSFIIARGGNHDQGQKDIVKGAFG